MSVEDVQVAEVIISDVEIAQKHQLIESVFNRIYQENMIDVPVNNTKLEVAVLGLQQWQNLFLGIVVTPWFMNIILLPNAQENWDDLHELSKQTFIFPSGRYSFITGRDKELGTYQMCSLFSPMYEFADQEAAIDTASVAIKELMNMENVEETDIDSEQIERIWKGEEPLPENIEDQFTDFGDKDKTDDEDQNQQEKKDRDNGDKPKNQDTKTETPLATMKENIQQPMSRRDLLRGRFLRDNEEHD